MGNDIRVCRRDGEPLVFTMEFAGAEWYCPICDGHEDLFGARVSATPELRARLDELTEQYERARAARTGTEYKPPQRAGDDGVQRPTCGGCGASPEPGTPLVSGKPRTWFSRTIDGVTSFACSRACIPEREAVLPW